MLAPFLEKLRAYGRLAGLVDTRTAVNARTGTFGEVPTGALGDARGYALILGIKSRRFK